MTTKRSRLPAKPPAWLYGQGFDDHDGRVITFTSDDGAAGGSATIGKGPSCGEGDWALYPTADTSGVLRIKLPGGALVAHVSTPSAGAVLRIEEDEFAPEVS